MPRPKVKPIVAYESLPDESTLIDIFDFIFSLILEEDGV